MNRELRILLVDDNPTDRSLVIRQLRQEFPQLQVQEIIDARDLARAVAADEFDVVITDYQLGWNNGLEVLRTIKEHYPRCPVIMFTNTGNEEIAVEAMKSGLDDYVLKAPNRYIRIPVAVRVALERSETQRRAALLDIRFQSLLNRLKVGVFRANSQGTLLECNPAFLELLGVSSLSQAQAVQQLNLQEIYLQLTNMPAPQHQEREVQLRRADGTQIWTLLNTTLNAINGEMVVDGLIEDITARKQAQIEIQQINQVLEERVRERTAQLEAANHDLEEFAYSVSHDLREPLRVIQGLAYALLEDRGEQLNSVGQDYIQRIVANAQQGNVLIQDLLTYSQISRAEIPLRPIDLSSVLADILNRLEPELQQRRAIVNVEEPLPTVIGNRSILVQVLTNLLTNAIKFVAPGVQPHVRIWVEEGRVRSQPVGRDEVQGEQGESLPENSSSASPALSLPTTDDHTQERQQQVRLWVQDNGIGIALEQQQRIFNVFERLHGSEEYPGTGIGLAIVRKGVERMGGQVGVESQPGQGSRFWVELLIR